jgi:predicted nuclease with TOPRIM domain
LQSILVSSFVELVNNLLHSFSYEDVQHRRENDRDKIVHYTTAIAEGQAEAEMLRSRFKSLTDEQKRLNVDNTRIWDELQKARTVCDNCS